MTFANVVSGRQVHDGRSILIVSGSIVNSGRSAQSVAEVEAVLTDSKGQPVDKWIFRPATGQLRPGQEASFSTSRTNPPATAQSLALHLKEK